MTTSRITRQLELQWDPRDVRLTAEDRRDERPSFVGMQYVGVLLDRKAINGLISALRRARDDTYGADE